MDQHNLAPIDTIETMDTLYKQRTGSSSNNGRRFPTLPYVKIIEQPASKALRFSCERQGISARSIPGVNSNNEHFTYPTIQIVGFRCRVVVVVSCVTIDKPYRPHPNRLVGNNNCKYGICSIEINNKKSMTKSFHNLTIQRVQVYDIEEVLNAREEMKVDPYRTGFSHKECPSLINLNAVRLCFQAFIIGRPIPIFNYTVLEPVVSDPIYSL